MRPLIDADAVAARLSVDRYRVYELARNGQLPCVRLGRSIRFDASAIEEFIASGGTQPKNGNGNHG